MVAAERPAAVAWLVCFGEPHDVIADTVSCPLKGQDVPLEDCLDCRHLTSVSEERSASRWCTIDGE
jgi:hypothetical protein